MEGLTKNLILVSAKSGLAPAFKIYDRLTLLGTKSLILTGFGIEVSGQKYASKSMQFYQKAFRLNFNDIRQDSYSLFSSLAESEVYKGETLRKLTSYKDISLWDLCALYLSSEVIPLLYYINIGDKILDCEKPKKVYLVGSGPLDKIFYLLCKKKSIDFHLEEAKNENGVSLIMKKGIGWGHLFIKRNKRLLVSFYYYVVNLVKYLRVNKSYKVIFFAPIERFFVSMLPVVKKYSGSNSLVVNSFPWGASKKLRENKVFYTDLYGYKLYGLFNWGTRAFLKNISTAVNSSNFFSKASYKGISHGDLFEGIIEKLIFEEFPEKIRLIDIVRKIILSFKPDTVVVSNTSYDIALIAKGLSRNVVAMQCAHPQEFTYFSPVIADAVTVDGSFWRDYLIKNNVGPDKIFVTGAPKFDFLKKGEAHGKINSLFNHLIGSKKIVVFATPYSSLAMGTIEYEKIEKLKYVCNAVKNIDGAYLIIKLHPFDDDWRICQRIAKESGLLNYTVIKEIQMLTLLDYCDLLITYHSVAGYEAVLMDKNVIWINNSSDFRCDDVWDFRRLMPVAVVEDLTELEHSIRDILFNLKTRSELVVKREGYRAEHIYKLDGNAANRVKAAIDALSDNKNHGPVNQRFKEFSRC